MRVSLPLNGPTKEDRAIQSNAQRSINMYPAVKHGDSKSDLVLYSHPGYKFTKTVGTGPIRNNPVKFSSKIWWVSGTDLYSQDTAGLFTNVGTLSTSGSRVVMAPGRNVMMLVDGTNGYYTDGSTLTLITDADFPASPTHVTYKDGYFIVNNSTTDDWYINTTTESAVNWDALDFATDAAKPDKTLAVIAHANNIYAMGEDSIQAYFNSGNADFPFDAYPGSMPIGIDAPFTAVSTPLGLAWLGGTSDAGGKAIYLANGMQHSQISDPDLTWQINQLSTTSNAIAWMRRQGGNTFYEITFPTAGRTWSLNLEDNAFPSELKSYGYNRTIGAGCGFINGKTYVGSYLNGDIFELDFATYADGSNPFIRKRVTRVFHKDGLGMTFRSIILDPESGVGLITGQGSDPQVMMRYSVDGGRTWSSELWRSLGAIGQPEYKPTWTNLGHGYDWVFEFACSDPVKFNLFNLFADLEVGRN